MHSIILSNLYLALAFSLLLGTAILLPAAAAATFSPEPFVLDIEHSFGGGVFEKRGNAVWYLVNLQNVDILL